MKEHFAVIERFGCAVRLDTAPDPLEIALVNDVCNSERVSEGSQKLRQGAALLTRHSLVILSTCAGGLWKDRQDIPSALAVCSWALEVALWLRDRRAEATISWMFVGLLLANGRSEDALRMLARARKAVAQFPDLRHLGREIDELEKKLRP